MKSTSTIGFGKGDGLQDRDVRIRNKCNIHLRNIRQQWVSVHHEGTIQLKIQVTCVTEASSDGRAIDCRSIGHWFDSGASEST